MCDTAFSALNLVREWAQQLFPTLRQYHGGVKFAHHMAP